MEQKLKMWNAIEAVNQSGLDLRFNETTSSFFPTRPYQKAKLFFLFMQLIVYFIRRQKQFAKAI